MDKEGALDTAQRLKVRGTPTVIIFSPKGNELTRMRGSSNIGSYNQVLYTALNNLTPISELAKAGLRGDELSDGQWQTIALYSWRRDQGKTFGDEAKLYTRLNTLADNCPDDLITARNDLSLAAFAEWHGDENGDKALADMYIDKIEVILSSPMQSSHSFDYLVRYAKAIVSVQKTSDAQTKVQAKLQEIFEGIINDNSQNTLIKIDALYGWLDAALTGDDLTTSEKEYVKKHALAIQQQLGNYQYHAGLTTLYYLYLDAKLTELAQQALFEGVDKSHQSYWFMSMLSSNAGEKGHTDKALEWSERAWSKSQGTVTRARWGASHLMKMVKFDSDNVQGIEQVGIKFLNEISGYKKALIQPNGIMKRIDGSLRNWAYGENSTDERIVSIKNLKSVMTEACLGLKGVTNDSPCTQFLAQRL